MGDSGAVYTQPVLSDDLEALTIDLTLDHRGHLRMCMVRTRFWDQTKISTEHIDCGDLEVYAAALFDRVGAWVQAQHNLRVGREWEPSPDPDSGPFSGDLRPATP